MKTNTLLSALAAAACALCAGCASFRLAMEDSFIDGEGNILHVKYGERSRPYTYKIVSPMNGAELECTDKKMVRITLPAPNLSVIDGYICQNDSPKGTMYVTKDGKWKYLTIGIRSRLYLVNETGDDYLLVFDGELFNDQDGGAR